MNTFEVYSVSRPDEVSEDGSAFATCRDETILEACNSFVMRNCLDRDDYAIYVKNDYVAFVDIITYENDDYPRFDFWYLVVLTR